MKQGLLSTTTEFKEIETLEPGSWINLVNPSQSESMEIASAFNIDIADLRAPLDAEEMSRMTIEDEYTLIIVGVPIKEERNNQTYYVTIPLGIILTEEAIITTCLEKLPLLDIFINRRLRNFYFLCGRALSFRSSIVTPNSTCLRFVPWIERVNRLKANCTNQRVMKS